MFFGFKCQQKIIYPSVVFTKIRVFFIFWFSGLKIDDSAAVDLLFHRKGKNKERSLIGLSQNERNEEEINQCCMSQQIINLFLLLLKSRLTKNS